MPQLTLSYKTAVLLSVVVLLLTRMQPLHAQLPADSISKATIRSTLQYLAADSMNGRANYSPQLLAAAQFIEQRFQQSGLKKLLPSYLQPFTTKKLKVAERVQDTAGYYDPHLVLYNVIGMLPGKSRANEIILFSAHYDHVGTGPTVKGDSIYNGANDDASGTAALLALADYFSRQGANERTLVFCAFAGEEIGLFGSRYFVQTFNTYAIKAVINIEMVGRAGIGKKAVFITGARQSNFASIFKKNTKGSIRIWPEPDSRKQLFQRSDNYSFAKQGIAAHSIMAGDDNDPCYHQPCDEVQGLDIANITAIVRAIAYGCRTIVDGTDTPVLRLNR